MTGDKNSDKKFIEEIAEHFRSIGFEVEIDYSPTERISGILESEENDHDAK